MSFIETWHNIVLTEGVNDLKYKTHAWENIYIYDKMVYYVLISQAKKFNLCMKWVLPVIDRLCWSFEHAIKKLLKKLQSSKGTTLSTT